MIGMEVTAMEYRDDRLEGIYTGLCKVMRYPQDFGLSRGVPPPLARLLEETLCTLSQIMQERAFSCEELESELSQDADQPVASLTAQ